jgi:hypothetical protein
MAVDSRKVSDRRVVHFDRLQDLVADAERLAAGPVRSLGNRSFEQILGHLALFMSGSINNTASRNPLPW